MREIWTKEKVIRELVKYIRLQGTQIGVKDLEEIIRQIIEAAYSGSPGPGPTPVIEKCLQVDREQNFSIAEKIQGISNLGEQQIQDAIKEIAAELKNKIIDADNNTIRNLETDNFKNTALAKSTDAVRALDDSVDTKLTTEKFLQKTLHNIELPEEDKDAANKKYVDDLVAELEGKILKFKGFVSPDAPTGSIKNGSFWYQGSVMPTTFPINVRKYNSTTGQWSTTTSQYTPQALDLWANLNDNKGYYWFGNAWNILDDNGKVMFVSTFTGVTGDQKMLYYLDTAYGTYKKGFYRYNGVGYVNINPKEFFYVSTFNGVEGDDEALYYLDTEYGDYEIGFYRFIPAEGATPARFVLLNKGHFKYVSTFTGETGDIDRLYYLDTAYGDYKKGFYRFVPAAGTTPAKFELIGSNAEVFTDVDELPDADISKATIYRIPYSYYEYQGQKVEKEDAVFYGPGAQCLNMACDNTNGLSLESSSQSYQYPLADITDALVQQLITDQLIQVKSTKTDAPMFKMGTNSYCPSEDVTEVDGGYKLYHNPTETVDEYIEIGGGSEITLDEVTTETVSGKVQANAIIDVDVFPTTGIKEATFYRKREDHFIDASDNEVIAVAKYICDGNHLEAMAVGLIDKSTGVPTPWAALTDAIVDGYVASGYCRVTEAIADTPYTLYFIKAGTDEYAHLMCIKTKSLYHHEDGAWKLVSEDSSPDGVTIETVNNKLQANAVIDVDSLPTTGIKSKTIYRMLVDKYYEDGNALASVPTGYVSIRPAIVIIDENGITDNGTFYAWADITDDQMDFWVIRRQISQVYAADLMTMSTCFKTADNHYVYKDHVTKDQVYELYHNPTATANAFIKIGDEDTSVDVDGVTIEEVNGKLQANAVLDVTELPSTEIKSRTLYRTRDMSYEYEGVQFPKSELVWYGPGPDCTSMDADDVGVNIRAASGNRSYPWSTVNATLIQELSDLNLVAVGVDEADAVFFSHFATYGPKSGLTTIYGDYHLYHNPSQTAGGYIEIGGDAVQYVSTFAGVTGDTSALYYLDTAYGDYKVGFYRFNGTFQFIGTDVILTVETLPTTGISDSVFYRLVEYHKFDNGWEIPVENTFMSNSPRMIINPSGIEYTDPQSQIHPYNWADVTDDLVTGWMTGGELKNMPLSDRNFDGKFYKKQDGTYDAMNGGTAYVYVRNEYKLYHNPTKSSSGYVEVGGGSNITLDDVTTETVAGKVQANAVIDVTTLPTTEIKTKSVYRIRKDVYIYEGAEVEVQSLFQIISGRLSAGNLGLTLDGTTQYAWSDVTDTLIQSFVSQNLVQLTTVWADRDFLRLTSGTYAYLSMVSKTDGYDLYHNPTGNAAKYTLIGSGGNTPDGLTAELVNGKLQANAIVDVDYLPESGSIKTKSIYRVKKYLYSHGGTQVAPSDIVLYCGAGDTMVAGTDDYLILDGGPTPGVTTHPWAEVTDTLIASYISAGYMRETDNFNGTAFARYGANLYDKRNNFTRQEDGYALYHNPTGSTSGFILIGGGSVTLDDVTTETVDGKVQANAIIDVNSLPTSDIKAKTVYRMLVDKYYEDGNVLPARPTGYVSNRPAIVIIDENGITDDGTLYPWADIDDEQMDRFITRNQINEVPATELMTTSTCFKTAANHYVYKDHVTKDQVYELYHNPTATANAFIKIGGEEGGSVEVDEVTTEEVNGKVQANAVIVVNDLPTTGIKTKSLYRRMTQVYRHDGVEVNSVSPYKVNPNDTLEATPEGLRYKPEGPTVAWDASNIAQVVSDGIRDGYIEATTWENAEFFGYGDDPTSGNFDYKNHFSRLLPGSLWQNPTGTAAGWEEVGGERAIDEVTIVEENSILQAVAVIDVTTLPSVGMKVNSLYRKVETVMVPGLHIYTTYYHGGADPVPEPVECYKPARAGVEFRTNEIYIDSVQHSYEELKVYKADWVAAGYIVACDFLDIDTTTNDGAVGYPNEGSYQFLNRARYTYNTDPVPVVMNKIFQRTPGGEWESISTVQISNAAYNQLDSDQKMDGTTYIVEG